MPMEYKVQGVGEELHRVKRDRSYPSYQDPPSQEDAVRRILNLLKDLGNNTSDPPMRPMMW